MAQDGDEPRAPSLGNQPNVLWAISYLAAIAKRAPPSAAPFFTQSNGYLAQIRSAGVATQE